MPLLFSVKRQAWVLWLFAANVAKRTRSRASGEWFRADRLAATAALYSSIDPL
jgi:hypothetical protein